MLKISYAGCLGLPPAISLQFTVEMCAASKNCKKFTTSRFFVGLGQPRSSMLTNLKSSSPVLVTYAASLNLSATIFTLYEPIAAKWRLFNGVPLLTPSFEGNPLTQGHEILLLKSRVFGASNSGNFVILAGTILIQITSVTDGRTDKRLDVG